MSVRVLIVDDSPFSRTIIADTLTDAGYEVVGEADSLDELLKIYSEEKPDIVTMDIAMPEHDGFDCSRALLREDPKAKIVLLSSMKDEETETEAKRIGVSGYVQKPIEAESITKVITNILSPDSLFLQLKERALETFQEALAQNITRMTKSPVQFAKEEGKENQYSSQGITTVIGIIGQYSGSMIMDISEATAGAIAEKILKRPPKGKEEVLAMVAELANIIAGIGCSMLNKKEKALGLRVSPPSMFHGNNTEIISPTVDMEIVIAETDYGKVILGIGFKKGSVLWM
ncbi:MAG: response regulator [Sporomusaceae bacterium]|nr:response regulator [Sporomusaceae bacterium]